MATFNTKKMLNASPALIPVIATRLVKEFQADGYDVVSENLISGGADVSISKGGIFKSVIGMKTALKISLVPQNGAIKFEAGVGIFGKQIIPTLVMWYVAWPVMLTQVWGLIQQSKLDDKALEIAEKVIAEGGQPMMESNTTSVGHKFCTNCGTKNTESAKFCCGCGKPL